MFTMCKRAKLYSQCKFKLHYNQYRQAQTHQNLIISKIDPSKGRKFVKQAMESFGGFALGLQFIIL